MDETRASSPFAAAPIERLGESAPSEVPSGCEPPFSGRMAPIRLAECADSSAGGGGPSRSSASVYAAVWRLHLYAGIVVAPLLVISAVTGGLLLFREDAERLSSSSRWSVRPDGERRPLLELIATVRGAFPAPPVTGLSVDSHPARPAVVTVRDRALKRSYRVHVNPYTAAVLGTSSPPSRNDTGFFPTVEAIHRQLLAGMAGRVAVELTTSWGIVLLLTGLYLVRPRRMALSFRQEGRDGPRLLSLRELHRLAGLLIWPVAMTIFLTALWFTPLWGRAFRAVARQAGMVAFVVPPRSAIPKSAGGDPLAGLDSAVATLRSLYPDGNYFIGLPQGTDDGYFVTVQGDYGPSTWAVLVLARADGTVLTHRRTEELGFMDWWTRWNLPLHAGSAFGLVSRVLWGIAAVGLTFLPLSGLWMWWRRRPTAVRGARSPIFSVLTRPVAVSAVLLSLLLPAVGASLAVVLAVDWMVSRFRRPPQIA